MSIKRFLSFLTTVALVFLLLPAAASAATHTVATAEELKDALTTAASGDIIQLSNSIDSVEPIDIAGFTLDVGAHTLTITVVGPTQQNSAALKVGAGGVVAMEEGGQININATNYDFGVFALDGGIATVTNVTLHTDTEDSVAVWALNDGSAVTVKGNVEAIGGNYPNGLMAESGMITVEGDVFVKGVRACGADANGGSITVKGRISIETMSGVSSQAGIGAYARSAGKGGTITAGSILSDGIGVIASSGSTITVNGDVSVKGFPDEPDLGVNAFDASTVTVNGNISIEGMGDDSSGIRSTNGSEVIVRGDVTLASNDPSSSVFGVTAESSAVTIDGSITLAGTGAGVLAMSSGRTLNGSEYVWGLGSEVRVGKNVTVTGTDGVGVRVTSQSIVVIDGILSAKDYTWVNYFIGSGGAPVLRAMSDGVRGEGPWAYYLMYTDADPSHAIPKTQAELSEQMQNNGGYYIGTGTVYVQVQTGQPIVITEPAANVTALGVTLSGNVIDDGGAWVRERGFVYGKTANPILGGTDVSHIATGNGTGSFSGPVSGLAPNTTYYVRAYATNRSGTAYGETITFTTPASNVSVPNTGDYSASLGVWICAMAAIVLMLGIRKRQV